MKSCPVCALELEDSYLFCPDDGSALAASAPDGSAARVVETRPALETTVETTNAVLYCPACGAEYPLTFSSCPVHEVPLSKRRISSQVQQAANDSAAEAALLGRPHMDRPPFVTHLSNLAIANGVAVNSKSSTAVGLVGNEHSDVESSDESRESGTQHPPAFLSEARDPEHHGFRIAAIATMIALGVFALVGLYALVSNLSRRPSSVARTAGQTELVEPVPFVVTPREALDYKEEQPAASASAQSPEPPAATRTAERERKEILSSSNDQRDPTTPVARSVATSHPPAAPAPVAATQASGPPVAAMARADSGEFDSRLVRARANRTSSGYRYDLTFNMQEQRGRSAHWQRVLITTRSAAGTSHTQAIPFVHRLGATGALTFTISVELTGRSEADWRGRINCTTLGWDNAGAPLQASFVANVTP